MKFSIARAPLLAALGHAKEVSERKSTVEVLANVLLRAGRNAVTIAATDLSVTLVAELAASVGEPGGITINARRLYDVIKGLSSESVTVEMLPGTAVQVKGGTASYKLSGLRAEEFPKVDDLSIVAFDPLDGAAFARLIDSVLFCVLRDMARPSMAGALLAVDNDIATAVGIDGSRLAVATSKIGSVSPPPKTVIPFKALADIKRVIDKEEKAEIGFHAEKVFVRVGTMVIGAKLLDSGFPPWEQVLKAGGRSSKCAVNALALAAAARRVGVMGTIEVAKIVVSFDDAGAHVSAEGAVGSGHELIPGELTGPAGEFGINATYFAEALEHSPGDLAAVHFAGDDIAALSPVMIRGVGDDSYTAVVMPMRR